MLLRLRAVPNPGTSATSGATEIAREKPYSGVDLTQQGDQRQRFGEGVEADRKTGFAAALQARARRELLAEFRFSGRAEGGLTSPRSFDWAIQDPIGLATGRREPQIRWLSERELERPAVRETLVKYFKTAQVGEMTSQVRNSDGSAVKIRYAAFLPPERVPIKGVITLSPGRGQSMLSFAETIYELREHRAAGYAIAVADHRGQGFSDRMLEDPKKGHVVRFQDYVDDAQQLHALLKRELAPRMVEGAKWSAAGHSMGGAIATRQEELHPRTHAALLALSPMYGIQTGLPAGFERAIIRTLDLLSSGDPYVPGAGPNGFKSDRARTTHSASREKLTRWLDEKYPALTLGGPTRHWLLEALDGCTAIARDAEKVSCPAYMCRSLDDRVVDPEAQTRVAKAGRFETFDFTQLPGEREPVGHALLNERDRIHQQVTGLLAQLLTRGKIG